MISNRLHVWGALLALAFSSPVVAAPVPAKTDVVIVGAGLSGLATAYGLKKAHIPYHVLELTPRVGGRVRTVHYKLNGEELSADSGMEEYWESNPAVKLLEELKLPTRGDVALSSIVLGKQLYPLGDENFTQFMTSTLGADNITAWTELEKKVRAIVDETRAGKLSAATLSLKEISFAKWLADQKTPPKLADWIRVSIECEAGASWEAISALDGIAEMHIFLAPGEKSFRVQGGNEKFTDTLARTVGQNHISVNQRVNRIVTRDGKVFVYYLDTQTNRSSVIEAKQVVSTIPLFRLFEVQFEPALSDKKRQAITSQTWGSYFKAHVFIPRSAWKVFERKGASILPILSDSELGVIYDGNPDQKTKLGILSLLVTGPSAEMFNMMPLDQVRPRIRDALEKLFPGIEAQIQGVEFYRFHPRAIAAWPPGRSRFDELSEEMRRPEHQVYFAGDFTETSHSDGAFLSAARVVRQILNSRPGGYQ